MLTLTTKESKDSMKILIIQKFKYLHSYIIGKCIVHTMLNAKVGEMLLTFKLHKGMLLW